MQDNRVSKNLERSRLFSTDRRPEQPRVSEFLTKETIDKMTLRSNRTDFLRLALQDVKVLDLVFHHDSTVIIPSNCKMVKD